MTGTGRGGPVERTDLAWRRTALAALALGGLALKATLSRHEVGAAVTASIALVTAGVCYLCGRRRSAADPAPPTAQSAARLVAVVAAMAVACAAATTVAVFAAR
jgi:uncharacterized membrane protein YidH (DUF202 family)